MNAMIDGALAQALRAAGVRWNPQNGDWFCLVDDPSEPWLVAPGAVELALIEGQPALLFHGASEWALDSVLAYEVLWLPSEQQIRQLVLELLGVDGRLSIDVTHVGTRCRVHVDDWQYEASALTAVDAYALAYLAVHGRIR
jgi:hypothetical protein